MNYPGTPYNDLIFTKCCAALEEKECYERSANLGKSIYVLDGVDKEYKSAYANLVKEVLENG